MLELRLAVAKRAPGQRRLESILGRNFRVAHPELIVKRMRWHSPTCRSYKFLDPENSAVRHFSILELPSLNAPALWFGESAPRNGRTY